MRRDEVKCESVLDFPREDLDQTIWLRDSSGKYSLRPECKEKVLKIVDAIVQHFKIPQCRVNITGSITSNSYSDASDIDLHFNSPEIKEDIADQLSKRIREFFEKYKEDNGEESWHLGDHPVEVYFQGNPFQDMMSVGCYSVLDDKWIVGPELTSKDFNPYSEYYDEDMRYVNNLIGSVREIVLEAYEKSLVFNKLDKESQQKSGLKKVVERAAKMFTSIRETRSAFSAPKSREEALEKRSDRRWKIADSAFKLLDKFGYLAILREMTKCFEEKASQEDISERVVKVVREKLGPENKSLHEIEEDERSKKFKIWVDDIREAPRGYVWLRSTNDFISFIESNGVDSVEVLDIDHDAGDYQADGGDYIKCLDYLRFLGAKDLRVRLHTQNPVGRENMRRLIQRAGWKEIEESDELDESFKSAALAFALACASSFPGILHGKSLQCAQALDKNPSQQEIRQRYFTSALRFVDPEQKINKYTFAQNVNIIACTYYGEGRSEIKLNAFDPIVDTTLNRASQDISKVALVCIAKRSGSKYFQYSFWNQNQRALQNIENGDVVIPQAIKTNSSERAAWNFCLKRAVDILTGKYTSQNKEINSYYVANMENPPSWRNQMENSFVKGHHRFGYVKSNDPKYVDMTTLTPIRQTKSAGTKIFRNSSQMTYVVRSGDTLSKIAKDNNTTVDELMRKNGLKDKNKIRIGQRLKI